MIKTVYIASPYTVGDQALNVRKSMDCANDLFNNGYIPFIPLLSHFQHMIHPRNYMEWIDYDYTWVSKCDALLRLPGESKGADMEVEHAKKCGIPIFYTIEYINEFNIKKNFL